MYKPSNTIKLNWIWESHSGIFHSWVKQRPCGCHWAGHYHADYHADRLEKIFADQLRSTAQTGWEIQFNSMLVFWIPFGACDFPNRVLSLDPLQANVSVVSAPATRPGTTGSMARPASVTIAAVRTSTVWCVEVGALLCLPMVSFLCLLYSV